MKFVNGVVLLVLLAGCIAPPTESASSVTGTPSATRVATKSQTSEAPAATSTTITPTTSVKPSAPKVNTLETRLSDTTWDGVMLRIGDARLTLNSGGSAVLTTPQGESASTWSVVDGRLIVEPEESPGYRFDLSLVGDEMSGTFIFPPDDTSPMECEFSRTSG